MMNNIPELIQQELEDRTLREFADAWNEDLPDEYRVSFQSVSNWASGKHRPKTDYIIAAMRAYRPADEVVDADWRYSLARAIWHAMWESEPA